MKICILRSLVKRAPENSTPINCSRSSPCNVKPDWSEFYNQLKLTNQLLQDNAEIAVKDMLKEIARQAQERTGTTSLAAVDYMDNGAPIAMHVDIDPAQVQYALIK